MARGTSGGSGPKSSTTAARMAAPVGVVSSPAPSARIGISALARSAAVAGAGTGTGPCAVRTTPVPTTGGSEPIDAGAGQRADVAVEPRPLEEPLDLRAVAVVVRLIVMVVVIIVVVVVIGAG